MARAKKKKNTGAIVFIVSFLAVVIIGAALILPGLLEENSAQPSEPEISVPEQSEPEINYFPDITELNLTYGESYTVEAEGFTWASSDSAYAEVNNGVITAKRTGTCTITATDANGTHSITVSVSPKIEMIDGVTYVNDILIANKTYGLPEDFGGDNDEAWEAFDRMAAAAEEEGLYIYGSSVYRSYYTQKAIYDREYNDYGFEYVEQSTARPGHSEHQTGLAFDLNSISMGFADTAEGQWVKEHCHEYGFILRYMEGKEHLTGYMYEPWHFRYIGEQATDVHNSGLCLEEYLGIDSEYKD